MRLRGGARGLVWHECGASGGSTAPAARRERKLHTFRLGVVEDCLEGQLLNALAVFGAGDVSADRCEPNRSVPENVVELREAASVCSRFLAVARKGRRTASKKHVRRL